MTNCHAMQSYFHYQTMVIPMHYLNLNLKPAMHLEVMLSMQRMGHTTLLLSRMGNGTFMPWHVLFPSKTLMAGGAYKWFVWRWCHHVLIKTINANCCTQQTNLNQQWKSFVKTGKLQLFSYFCIITIVTSFSQWWKAILLHLHWIVITLSYESISYAYRIVKDQLGHRFCRSQLFSKPSHSKSPKSPQHRIPVRRLR